MKNIIKIMLIAVIGITLWGCGGGSSTGPSGPTAADYTAEGWTHFDASEYAEAGVSFQNAINKDANYYEAYMGKAFIFIADPSQYNEATADSNLMVIYNNRATVSNDILIPTYAAMCAYKVKNNSNLTFVKGLASTLNSMSNSWTFSHNNSELDLNWAMTRLNQAEIYFYGSSSAADHLQAKGFLDLVRNSGSYASLAQYIKDKADALHAQFTAAGLY